MKEYYATLEGAWLRHSGVELEAEEMFAMNSLIARAGALNITL